MKRMAKKEEVYYRFVYWGDAMIPERFWTMQFAETLFPDAERIMNTCPPLGYAINRGGIGPDINTEYWALASDPLDCERDEDGLIRSECLMCLVKFFDGSPVAVRYRQTDIISY